MSPILTLTEACDELHLSRWTVRDLIKAGVIRRIPHTGRKVLIASAEIDRFASLGVSGSSPLGGRGGTSESPGQGSPTRNAEVSA